MLRVQLYSVSSHSASACISLRKFDEILRSKVQMPHLERRTRKKDHCTLPVPYVTRAWHMFVTSQQAHVIWHDVVRRKGVRNLKRDICGVSRLRGENVESDDSRS